MDQTMTVTEEKEKYLNGDFIKYQCLERSVKPGGNATCVKGAWSEPVECKGQAHKTFSYNAEDQRKQNIQCPVIVVWSHLFSMLIKSNKTQTNTQCIHMIGVHTALKFMPEFIA